MRIDKPFLKGGADVSGSFTITGSLLVTDGVTGTATSASYVEFSDIGNNPFISGSNAITASGDLVPFTNEAQDLGSPTLRWKDLYLSGSTLFLGDTKITRTEQGDVEFRDSQTDVLRKIKVDEIEIGTGDSARKIRVDSSGGIKFTTMDNSDRTMESLGFTEMITSSAQISFNGIADKPSLVSGSSQITLSDTDGFTSYSGSVATSLNSLQVESGSIRTNFNNFTGSYTTGSFTGSFTGDGSGLTNLPIQQVDVSDLLPTSSFNSYTSSADGRINSLESYSSSLSTALSIDGSNVTVLGNFQIAGTTTTIDSTTVQIGDNIIELNAAGAVNGGLLIKDVTAPNTISGSLLWNTTTDRWIAGPLGSESNILLASGDGVISGSSQVAINSTTGTLNVNKGGTGQTSYTNGQLLIGNTTGNTLTKATLTEGTGITITNGTGTITVTNSSPNATHTGDVTGATALTIANNAVTNAKAADMAVSTIKGRVTAGTGDPEDLTAAQVRTLLNVANGATANTGTVTSVSGTGTTSGLTLSGTVTTSGNLTLSGTVNSLAAGTYGISVSGNAATATTFSTGGTNYKGVTDNAVAGQLMWKEYGNNHTIFDASDSTSPSGGAVNNTNAQVAWTGTYPTLMGWNGANTYGVRVDSARVSDNTTGNAATATTAANSNALGGLAVHTGVNNLANRVVRTNSSGYADFGWINTISGDNGTTAINRIYASSDAYIRYYTPVNFRQVLDVPTRTGGSASGTWGINVTGNAGSVTNGVYTTGNQSIGGIKTFTSTGPYTNDWFRNNTSGYGLYNQATGRHFYSPGTSYWHIDGASTAGGLIIYDRYNGTQGNATGRRGYLYYDSSGFGLLHQNGGWAVRTTTSLVEIYNRLDAPIMYDSNNTAYYVDPSSESRQVRIRNGPYAGSVSSGNVTGLEILNNGGTGENNVAAISFHCSGQYGMHMHLRADSYFGIGGWSASTWRWYVQMSTGDMTAAGNVTAYSDPRLKEDITQIDSPLQRLSKLDGVRFKWKNNSAIGHPGTYDYGILANQVEEQFPEIVHGSPHIAPEGDEYKTVAYDKLIPILIEAIKEQQTQIDTLTSEINTLKEKTK